MSTYSIKDLETLSGIKAHTIRIWEQRYRLIEPKRTATNIRYYTDEDLKFVLNIALLNKNGLRISQIAKMSKEQLLARVESVSRDNPENGTQLQALTMAMMALDAQQLEQILQQQTQSLGFENCLLELVIPFLEKLSLLWITGAISNVHEQFVHNILRRKILSAIDQLPLPQAGAHSCMLYMMEGEEMELVLLLAKYFMRRRGIRTIYLGMRIHVQDLLIAHKLHKPNMVFTSISEVHPKLSLGQYAQELSEEFRDSQILLTGYQIVSATTLPDLQNVRVLEDFWDIVEFLDEQTQ